ncbi:MAG: DUF2007 domain-containing protein [Candidatus Dadabacteria bacterium]|nr:MAG: DUF2007 domain-containing protein [Candidatus Dadabacteria bacterium]
MAVHQFGPVVFLGPGDRVGNRPGAPAAHGGEKRQGRETKEPDETPTRRHGTPPGCGSRRPAGGRSLGSTLPDGPQAVSWAEVYVALDAVEASAVTGLLASAGLEVRVRDMGVTPYPVSIGPLGEKRIEVPADRAEEARRILRQAARDGYLRPGALVQEEDEA